MSLWSLISFGSIAYLAVALMVLVIKEPIWKAVVILVAALLLKFRPGIDIENLVFIGSVVLTLVLAETLPFRERVNRTVAVIVGFAIFNLGLFLLR